MVVEDVKQVNALHLELKVSSSNSTGCSAGLKDPT